MQPELKKAGFLLGLVLFIICWVGMFFEQGTVVIIASHFLPGLAFSLLILHYSEYIDTIFNRFLFIFLLTLIYILAVFFVDVDSDNKMGTAIRLLIASSVGAVMLKVCYDHFYALKLKNNATFVMPFLAGLVSALPAAVAIYFYKSPGWESKMMNMLLYTGIFSIFPIWMYLMSVLIVKTDHGQDFEPEFE